MARLMIIGYTPIKVNVYKNNIILDMIPDYMIKAIEKLVDEKKLLNNNYYTSIIKKNCGFIINYVENDYLKYLEKSENAIIINHHEYNIKFKRKYPIKVFNNFCDV
jgi:hypothetical protein